MKLVLKCNHNDNYIYNINMNMNITCSAEVTNAMAAKHQIWELSTLVVFKKEADE